MEVTKDSSGTDADTMTGIGTLPPEMIGNIMDKIVEGQKPNFRSTTTKHEPLGVSDLGPFVFASKRHHAIYQDREYTMMRSLVERYSPSGPGMWESVVRLAALDKQCRARGQASRTLPEPMGQLFGVVEWGDLRSRIDELLKADVNGNLTPEVFKYIFATGRSPVGEPPLHLRLPMVPHAAAILVMQVPEAERAAVFCLCAIVELYNLAVAKRVNGSPSGQFNCPTALKELKSINEEFNQIFQKYKEIPSFRLQCTWENHDLDFIWDFPLFKFKVKKVTHVIKAQDTGDSDNEHDNLDGPDAHDHETVQEDVENDFVDEDEVNQDDTHDTDDGDDSRTDIDLMTIQLTATMSSEMAMMITYVDQMAITRQY